MRDSNSLSRRIPRTSVSDPLQIKVVPVPGFAGEIGMTLCPGRRDRFSPYAWDRDLAADLAVVRAWQPFAVVTLIEAHEFIALGVPQFGEAVAQAGLRWVHVPIPDAGVPDRAFEDAWRREGPRLRAGLRDGGRVLVHCRAGLGRTGMIAARLLAELGTPPKDAIAAVRAVQSQAIETLQQEHHVREVSSHSKG